MPNDEICNPLVGASRTTSSTQSLDFPGFVDLPSPITSIKDIPLTLLSPTSHPCLLPLYLSLLLPYLGLHLRSSVPVDYQTRCGGLKCGKNFKSTKITSTERQNFKSELLHLRHAER
ncbi:hypothetical protein E2C01_089014 [Portunus trituberculatus]|uniref:Uncharacterized protein n=1 Tax=Portunus trituberculatus TaxID=210409 RepID=A0A5B7JG61_PORTR|nr:hypothetical protein [Portunus trituberculatus]